MEMEQRNDDRAVDFLRLASRGDVEEAFARYVAPGFRHHNPWFAGDASSLMRAMADNARQHPAKSCETLRTVAEGELVCVHSRIRLEPEGRAVAAVHIFRFEGEWIAELWDVTQPEPVEVANEYGRF